MKIIEYTLGLPPYRRGGLPRYSTDLSVELSKNNDIYVIYPGEINPLSKKIKIEREKNNYPFHTVEMKNPLPVSLGLGVQNDKYYMQQRDISELIKLIKLIDPDAVHFHTLMGLPKEFLKYLHHNHIKTIYTTHDFYGLCPKMLTSKPKTELQSSKCSYDCMLCKEGPSYKKIVIMQSHLYAKLKESSLVKYIRSKSKANLIANSNDNSFSSEEANYRYELRKYYLEMLNLIDVFHFNSSVSKEYFKQYIPNIKGKVISITHTGLQDHRKGDNKSKYSGPIRLGYIGTYTEEKGFFSYTKILKQLSKKNKFEAHFYGDIINDQIFHNKFFVNHGVLPSAKLNKEYKKLDILIVPSCRETFGYTILESLLNGTPCLVSANVGAKDLVPKSWIFNDHEELKNKLLDLMSNSNKLKQMRDEVNHLSLQYKMDEHVDRIVTELYK
ncbi:glycosyltransferase [Limosilactobacillus reuteri]|uniref:glycosyltransferase n=1 Tax=Limosilactobacillus reuteri TaxID=1598 RepID=UPI001E587236|nr:glycosyltransferase [Limosilactobacillus reuteri]MCC4370180.1 glycosyltransferase [Limosilactobacillus reuteri]